MGIRDLLRLLGSEIQAPDEGNVRPPCTVFAFPISISIPYLANLTRPRMTCANNRR